MDKKIKIFLGFVAVVLIIGSIAGYALFKKSPTVQTGADTILFFGRECPHCQDVEKFLSDNKVADKVKYDSVEVWHNQDNAALMLKKAKACGLAEDAVGVPFAWSQGKCFIGTPDVEAMFKEKAGL